MKNTFVENLKSALRKNKPVNSLLLAQVHERVSLKNRLHLKSTHRCKRPTTPTRSLVHGWMLHIRHVEPIERTWHLFSSPITCRHESSHIVWGFHVLNAEQTFARVCDCANLGCVSSKPRVRTVFWSPSHLGMVTWLTPSPSSKSLRDVSPRSTPSPLLCALKRFTVSIDFCCVRLIEKHRIIKSVVHDNLNKQHKRADEDDTPLESHSVCQTSLGISQMHQHIQQ